MNIPATHLRTVASVLFIGTFILFAGGRRGSRHLYEVLGLSGWVPVVMLIGAGLSYGIARLLEHFDIDRRARAYEEIESQFAGARSSVQRRVERDVITLPGPPYPARVRHFHHTLNGRRRDYTEFVADIDGRAGAMRVSTPHWSRGLDAYYGATDILVGDPVFDRRFVIQGNPESLARDFLDPAARALIHKYDTYADDAFLLQVRPRQFVVRVGRRIQEGPLLRQFIFDCYALVQRRDAAGSGRGLEIQAVAVGPDAVCQVCGTKIDAPKRVLCRKCRTPHHADCWQYNDGCSVFACGERGSVRG